MKCIINCIKNLFRKEPSVTLDAMDFEKHVWEEWYSKYGKGWNQWIIAILVLAVDV